MRIGIAGPPGNVIAALGGEEALFEREFEVNLPTLFFLLIACMHTYLTD